MIDPDIGQPFHGLDQEGGAAEGQGVADVRPAVTRDPHDRVRRYRDNRAGVLVGVEVDERDKAAGRWLRPCRRAS